MKIRIREEQFKRLIGEQEDIQPIKKDFSDLKNKATQRLIDNIKKWETFVSFTYDDAYFPSRRYKGSKGDSVGVLTIGYGHTGEDVEPGDSIEKKEADILLDGDIKIASDCIRRWVKRQKNKNNSNYLITQGMYESMVELAFNLGCSGFVNSTIIEYIEQGKYKQAYNEIKNLKGDKKRREAMASLFCLNNKCV